MHFRLTLTLLICLAAIAVAVAKYLQPERRRPLAESVMDRIVVGGGVLLGVLVGFASYAVDSSTQGSIAHAVAAAIVSGAVIDLVRAPLPVPEAQTVTPEE